MTNIIHPQSTQTLGVAELAGQQESSIADRVAQSRVVDGLKTIADRVLYGVFEEPRPDFSDYQEMAGSDVMSEFEAGQEFAYDVRAWRERADGTLARIAQAPLAWLAGENPPNVAEVEQHLIAQGLSESAARTFAGLNRAFWDERLRVGIAYRRQQLKHAITGQNKEK